MANCNHGLFIDGGEGITFCGDRAYRDTMARFLDGSRPGMGNPGSPLARDRGGHCASPPRPGPIVIAMAKEEGAYGGNGGESVPLMPSASAFSPGQVEQLPPTELLDRLDRCRNDERLLGLLGGTTKLVLKDPQGGSPGIRPAPVQVLVQNAQRLRDKLI